MENFDHILLFKTNLEACNIRLLKRLFDRKARIQEWNIDLDDEDRVLRIISTKLKHHDIIQLITNHGYSCCELT